MAIHSAIQRLSSRQKAVRAAAAALRSASADLVLVGV